MRGPGSVIGIATGYGLDGPGIESRWRGVIFRTCPDRPWGPPSLLYNGYWVFTEVKSGRGVMLIPHPLLVPWSRKGRAIPLLPLWVVRPLQSLSACTVDLKLYSPYVPYGLYRASVPVQ
jgi:DNA-binding transcriptional LysR family regulator